MEMEVAANSSMVVKARKSGTITAVDSTHIVIDQTDEYPLEKFVGLNERRQDRLACLHGHLR